MSEVDRFSLVQRLLHWLLALLVIPALGVGMTLGWLGFDGARDAFGMEVTNALYTGHKTIGVLILALMTLRLVLRLTLGAPPPVPTLTWFERLASQAVQAAMYLVLLAMPLGLATRVRGRSLGLILGLACVWVLLVAALLGTDPTGRETLVEQKTGDLFGFREGNWKLLCQYDGSRPQLFDLERDRRETTDLSAQYADVTRRLPRGEVVHAQRVVAREGFDVVRRVAEIQQGGESFVGGAPRFQVSRHVRQVSGGAVSAP